MKSMDYCLPIRKSSPDEILDVIRNHDKEYRYFEVWLDYVEGFDADFVKKLTGLLGERLIVLFRRDELEPIRTSLETRLQLLKQLAGTPVLVDLDITGQTAELNYIREHNLSVNTIVSYHNYRETPDSVRLEEIIDTMKTYQPGIYKLAASCDGHEDALRLLKLLLTLKARKQSAIVLGMGEAGTITRVLGALWGNEMTFAPLTEAGQTAPGQLTRRQLEIIFKELRG